MKITLLGKAKGWQQANRANCKPGEVWGIDFHCLKRPFDKIFAMYTTKYIEKIDEEYNFIKTIIDNDIPFITVDIIKYIPTSISFPLEDMPFMYFNSSFDYMIAYAIYYGATEIQIFGCKVIKGGSHEFARPSIEFWLGYAMAKGIKLIVHPPSDLLTMSTPNGYTYGYWQTRPKAPAHRLPLVAI